MDVKTPAFIVVSGRGWGCRRPIGPPCAGGVESTHVHAVERAEAHAVYHNSVESRT